MSKFIDRELSGIRVGRDGRPRSFRWRGRSWPVARTADVWKDTGSWWEGEGEKVFFRLETAGGRLVELYLDRKAQKWFLYRVYD